MRLDRTYPRSSQHGLTAVLGILVLATFLSGCSSKNFSTASQNPLAVVITAPTSTLAGGQVVQFSATTNVPTGAAIVWSVTGGGTITPQGLYTAPASITANIAVTVTATATLVGAPSVSSSQTITVLAPAGISISPSALLVNAGQTLQFNATVVGSTGTPVWSVSSGPGTISSTGLYTAPPPSSVTANTTATITAVLSGTTGVAASQTITVLPSQSVAITTPATTVNLGQSLQFSASIIGSTGTPIWSISSGAGTISPAGLYVAPAIMPASSAVTIVATLSSNANAVATQTLTLSDPATLTIAPQSTTVSFNQPTQFTASIGKSAGTAIWSLSGAGTISSSGLYTPPATMPANTAVIVTATLSNDSNIKAAQSFTLVDQATHTITPQVTTVSFNQPTQFTANIGQSAATAVWSLTGPGTISSSGLYTPPATMPANAAVTITATFSNDSSINAVENLTLVDPATLAIAPQSTTVSSSQPTQFTANVGQSGGTVVWSLSGGGTLSSNGLYTPPATMPANPSVIVTATLSNDSNIKAVENLTLIDPEPLTIAPQSTTVSFNQPTQFSANRGQSAATVIWSLSGGGTLSSSGLYTPPATMPANAAVTITATLSNDYNITAVENLTVADQGTISMVPQSATVSFGQSTQFTANIGQSIGTAVWSLTGPGTISSSGLYTPPATMPANTAVIVTATLSNDSNIKAVQSLTLVDPATLTVIPQISTVNTNQPVQFSATLGQTTGSVVWSLSGPGTITQNGLYTAPLVLPSNTNVTVTAALSNDSSATASQSFTLVAVPAISINLPSSNVIPINGTLQLSATVEGIVDGVNWTVSGTGNGSISNGGRLLAPPGFYTAPATVPTPATVIITANLISQTSVTNSITLTVVNAPTILSASPAQLPTGQNNIVTLTGTGFMPGMQIIYNNEPVQTTVVNSTTATVVLSADPSFVTNTYPALGTVLLVAQNPSSGGTSAGFNLPVTPAASTAVSVGTTPLLNIPLGFLGVSQEIGAGEWIMGDNYHGVNYAQRNLYSYLMDGPNSPFLIRSGASNTDCSTGGCNDQVPQSVEEYNELHAVMPGVTVSLGLILDQNSNTLGNSQSEPTYAADNAAFYMANLNPSVLDSFEIGNEPDSYMYQGGSNYYFDPYIGHINTWMGAILDKIAPAKPQFTGPSFSSLRTLTNNSYWSDFLAVVPGYLQIYATDVKNFNKTISVHFYSNQGMSSWPGGTTFNAAFMLGHQLPLSAGVQLPTALEYQNPGQTPYFWVPNLMGWAANIAHQNGMNFRINEMNTASGGGIPGASDTFAASLWMVDTLFEFLSNGVDGVNIHSETGGVRQLTGNCTVQGVVYAAPCTPASLYSPWTFNVATPAAPINSYTLESVNPSYYGMYFFHRAIPDGSVLLPVNVQTPANLKVWATKAPDGSIRVVLVNKDTSFSGTVPVSLPGYGTAQTLTMQTSNPGGYAGELIYANPTTLVSTTGITVGGQTWDNSTDGTVQGTQTLGSIVPTSGVYNVTVAPTSAVMLIIH